MLYLSLLSSDFANTFRVLFLRFVPKIPKSPQLAPSHDFFMRLLRSKSENAIASLIQQKQSSATSMPRLKRLNRAAEF